MGWKPEIARVVAACGVLSASACSLLLDFSDKPDAAPTINPLCETFEPNDEPALATTVTLSERQSAALCGESDIDLYNLEVAAFNDISIAVDGPQGLNLSLELSTGGFVIDSSDGPGSVETIIRAAELGNQLEAGSYLIHIKGSTQAFGAKEGDYSVRAEAVANMPVDAGP